MAKKNSELAAKADSLRSRFNIQKPNEDAELSAKLEQLRLKFNSN